MKLALAFIASVLYATPATNVSTSPHWVIIVTEFGWDVRPYMSAHEDGWVCGEMWKIFNHPEAKNPITVECHYWPYPYIDESWKKRAEERK